jgi:hypothetical protein
MQMEVIRRSANSTLPVTVVVFIVTGIFFVRKPIKDSLVEELGIITFF